MIEMPSWKTHIFVNLIIFIFWLRLLYYFKPQTSIAYSITMLLFVIISSVFPDIDTSKSKIRNWFAISFSLIATVVYLLNFNLNKWYNIFTFFIISYFVIRFFPTRHRGLTHTVKFSFFFSLVMFLPIFLLFGFDIITAIMTLAMLLLSYVSHIALDRVIKNRDGDN